MGHSYNGYYSGLLIRQIRVRIPGGPLKIWLRRLSRLGRSPFKAEKRVRTPSELLITPHLTKQVQVATLSMWRYGFESRWGDQMALSHQSLSGGSSRGRALNENKSCLGF